MKREAETESSRARGSGRSQAPASPRLRFRPSGRPAGSPGRCPVAAPDTAIAAPHPPPRDSPPRRRGFPTRFVSLSPLKLSVRSGFFFFKLKNVSTWYAPRSFQTRPLSASLLEPHRHLKDPLLCRNRLWSTSSGDPGGSWGTDSF